MRLTTIELYYKCPDLNAVDESRGKNPIIKAISYHRHP
jgi:hypothetical protein